jgi:hypothetical protein
MHLVLPIARLSTILQISPSYKYFATNSLTYNIFSRMFNVAQSSYAFSNIIARISEEYFGERVLIPY